MGSLECLGLLLVTPSKGGISSSLVRCDDILAYIYQQTCHFFALNLDTDENYVFGRALFGAQFTGEIHRVAKSLCFIPGR